MYDEKLRMNNIYDVRHHENLYFVFPKSVSVNPSTSLKKKRIAVFVNLFYVEDISWYLEYLRIIPESISVCVFSSNEDILQVMRQVFEGRRNFYAQKKSNRGRDISALLVAGRSCFFDYDYVCFLHDKSWREPINAKETKIWRYNLWENMIGSEQYIQNLLHLFQEREDIGLLCPPEPIGERMPSWYSNSWSDCFDETRSLADRLCLKADISKDKPPVSLSTVFWCRTESLKKLLEYPWNYEDFPEEPLPISGTISHGIERVLAYVAQDAGYKTGMVMTDEYAKYLLSFVQYSFQNTFSFLNDMLGIRSLAQLNEIRGQREEIINFFSAHDNVYLYGAGIVGKRALKCMRAWNCQPKGFVVSDVPTEGVIEGIPVYQFDTITKNENIGIIITTSVRCLEEISSKLIANGIDKYAIWE